MSGGPMSAVNSVLFYTPDEDVYRTAPATLGLLRGEGAMRGLETDNVISGPMRGLKTNFMDGEQSINITTYIQTSKLCD